MMISKWLSSSQMAVVIILSILFNKVALGRVFFDVQAVGETAVVQAYKKEPWGLRVGLSNGTELLVYVYRNDVIRVRQTLPGEPANFGAVIHRLAVIQPLPLEATFTSWENSTQIGMTTEDGKIQILLQKNPFTLTFKNKSNQILTSQKALAWKESATNRRGFALEATQDENFLGIGGHGDYSVNRRGIDARLWNTHIDPDKGNDYQNPFFISSRGYAFLAMNSYESWLKLNHQNDGKIRYQTVGGALDFFIFEGKSPKELVRAYHWLTGFAPLPPRWAFGLWMSRTGGTAAWARATVQGFRQRQIPLDMLHLEGITAWTHVGPGNKELESLWAFLDEKGVRKGIWQGEVISKRYSESWWNEADRVGYFAKNPAGQSYLVPHFGNPAVEHSVIDFGNPIAFEWFKEKHNYLLDLGYDNVMVDGGVEEEEIKNDMLFEKGRYRGDEYHNIFSQVWVDRVRQVQLSRNPDRRPMAYLRGGWTGVHRYGTSWGGDQCWTFESMQNLIRKGISEGVTGLSFWSQDSGGFHSCWQKVGNDWQKPPRTRNFYERSVQWGAWNPIFRIHGEMYQGVGNEPWQFGADSERIITETIRERYRLLPFFYSLAYQSHLDGVPMMRALALEFPLDAKAWNQSDEHLVGSQILVAPMTSAGSSRSVYLPAGEWFDYYNPSQKYAGSTSYQYSTNASRLPVFVRAGSIIPKSPVVESISDGAPSPELILNAYRGPATSFNLYEDDGFSHGYRQGEFSLLKIERWKSGKEEWIRVYPPAGQYPGMPEKRRLIFKLFGYGKSKLKSCRIDNAGPINCTYQNGFIKATVDWDLQGTPDALSFVVELK